MLALYMSFIDDESQRRLFEEIYLNYRNIESRCFSSLVLCWGAILTPKMLSMMYS